MMLFSRAGFEDFVTGLPAVTLVEQWNSSVAKVGGKVFATLGLDQHDIVFKVGDIAFAGLTSLEGVGQAPYFAKGQWVSVQPDSALPPADLRRYLEESHRVVASKLTRKSRAALGLDV